LRQLGFLVIFVFFLFFVSVLATGGGVPVCEGRAHEIG
jgi:hypothetical protein